MRVLVIGAGPMGIAAAAGASDRGHDVTVVERGEVGASLRTWGPTRFFSPLAMNVSPSMRSRLGSIDDDALLTGPEYVEEILEPIAKTLRVKTNARVIAIGRRGLTRSDYAGHPLRAEKPFRVVLQDDETLEADVVLDASGGLVVPRAFGAGGLPPRGLSRLTQPPIRTLGELASRVDELRGKRVLVVGDGHSAANAIVMLANEPSVHVVWAVRTANRKPCEEVMNDPLPERQRVVGRANELAAAPSQSLHVERRAMVESLAANNGHLAVALTGNRVVEVDALAAFTGYQPSNDYLSEVAVEISPITEGGARLYRAISNVTDCLTVPAVKPEDLQSGEPGYYFVGSRAYGRSSGFLLNTGFAQLEVILNAL
ncbi:MAG TPA: FAD-dependent oxidoreductase [Thermoanaerobaculia bacterium]|nr:FAD-dependent oxidoreductase [Thermoanaerobaculia bacterium]